MDKIGPAGLQFAARVVLPRTVDPGTGQALTTVILGDRYSDVGRWQQLRLEAIPRLLSRQIHILRLQLGPRVDDREAYVDAVLLSLSGAAGTTNVWIDDLEVAGHAGLGRQCACLRFSRSQVRPSGSRSLARGTP